MGWLARSAAGDELTRYHVEAGIAWEHCRAPTFADTDWRRIAELYEMLDRIAPSPLNALNRAVAEAYLHGPQAGLERLAAVLPENVPARYPGWHAVNGELHFRLGRHSAALARLAGSPALYHCPRRSRILVPPPRQMPRRWRRARPSLTPAQGKGRRRKWRASRDQLALFRRINQ